MVATPTLSTRSSLVSAPRFTLSGSDALEDHLSNICQKFSAGCQRIIPQRQLEGIVLGGGYGRGEGGVLQTSSGDRPYNDLEFYVFVRGPAWLNEKRYAKALHRLNLEFAPTAELELEFKIISLEKLRRSPPSLFFHDLVMGHRWILGDEDLFAGCEHHQCPNQLPISEATRLLMNRCSGLLFAREKLEQKELTSADADFVYRNIAKTELALGDALLIALQKYHWSCLERGDRLDTLFPSAKWSWLAEVKKRHSAGIKFKLHPIKSQFTRDALEEQFREIRSLALQVWLWLENQRLRGDFQSATDYGLSGINKWPGNKIWRNRLASLKVFGLRTLFSWRSPDHPRDRILNALALVLWARCQSSASLEREVRRLLLLSDRQTIISAYRERWERAS